MRATIKDIAKQAGVSITTVSLVLNGKAYKIPDQTKKSYWRLRENLTIRRIRWL